MDIQPVVHWFGGHFVPIDFVGRYPRTGYLWISSPLDNGLEVILSRNFRRWMPSDSWGWHEFENTLVYSHLTGGANIEVTSII